MPRKSTKRAAKVSRVGDATSIALVVIAALALYFLISYSTMPAPSSPFTNITNSSPMIPAPVLNVRFDVVNDEITGSYGYWAMANYTRTITAYMEPNSSYIIYVTLRGNWTTFAGALSPNGNLTTFERADATGPFEISYSAAAQNATLNTSARDFGYIGLFDANGTAHDVLRQIYANQTGTADSGWSQTYFGISNFTILDYVGIFQYGNQKYSVIFNGTQANVQGNIAT